MVLLTEEIFHGKLHFLCSVQYYSWLAVICAVAQWFHPVLTGVSCEFFEISKNSFSNRKPPVAASVYIKSSLVLHGVTFYGTPGTKQLTWKLSN